MKTALLPLLAAVLLASSPTLANTLYTNGAYDPNQNGWNIGTDSVSDSFTLSSGSKISGFDIVVELYVPTFNSTSWSITYGINSGVFYGSGTAVSGVDLTQSLIAPSASVGWSWYDVSVSGLNLAVGQGTYWLTLNTYDFGGYPVWWNENDGPSQAWDSTAGHYVGSEAFSINGSSVPEPTSASLLLCAASTMSVLSVRRPANRRCP